MGNAQGRLHSKWTVKNEVERIGIEGIWEEYFNENVSSICHFSDTDGVDALCDEFADGSKSVLKHWGLL